MKSKEQELITALSIEAARDIIEQANVTYLLRDVYPDLKRKYNNEIATAKRLLELLGESIAQEDLGTDRKKL